MNADQGQPSGDCGGDCEEIQARLCSLFDEEITPEQARELLREIAECPGCHHRLQSEREIRALVRQCCSAQEAPATLRQRITMQIRVTRLS
ncbi:mycothiol system anti-sigma-R factor [Corynebacterium alimapuense]|uniref:Mycothiol system anti-sigma-R factor n=1 Tax=Corynebacterium alimapuense TaxID=1576874 RepID=A0A3M8K8E9_9CORY|nr:mycothiol system anti-sigma-R factor [Corynebacterium alimapuense]RNE48738.1 mycothiol system anti-sigma-R factor [Corynebacterium alimapuense]